MPKKIGQYQVIQTIGDGLTCKVKLAFDTVEKEKVAIKIIKNDLPQQIIDGIKNEIQAMSLLDHPNIVKLKYFGEDDYINEEKQSTKRVFFIVIELAKGGELFDFLSISGKFSEPMARYYMKQLLDGLEFCHRNKVCHRDLKPENLLLDKDYNLKIADFGFARDVSGGFGDGLLSTRCGTLPYMAPEIHQSKKYNGQSVDLFACAIILFVMVAQHQPFSQATEDEAFYKCFFKNRSDIFWKTMQQRNGSQNCFTQEFMSLLNGMLQVDPTHRPSIYEVMAHPWFNGPVPSQAEIVKEFQERHALVRAELDAQKKQKEQTKQKNYEQYREGTTLDGAEEIFKPKKLLDNFEQVFDQDTVFFSSYNPDMIEEALLKNLKNDGIKNVTVHQTKYKIKFEKVGMDEQSNTEDAVMMTVRINKVDENSHAVQFQRLRGSKISFIKYYQQFKELILNDFNDTLDKNQVDGGKVGVNTQLIETQ